MRTVTPMCSATGRPMACARDTTDQCSVRARWSTYLARARDKREEGSEQGARNKPAARASSPRTAVGEDSRWQHIDRTNTIHQDQVGVVAELLPAGAFTPGLSAARSAAVSIPQAVLHRETDRECAGIYGGNLLIERPTT